MKEDSQMFDILRKVERSLPDLLKDESGWKSLYIDYHLPFVERVWRPFEDDYRINLQCIHPCKPRQALLHPHPWPSAMKLFGQYRQGLGFGVGKKNPSIVVTTIMAKGSSYELTDKSIWHYVAPVDDPVMTLMVTGKPWNRWSPTSEKPLTSLPKERVLDILDFFRVQYKTNTVY